MMPFKLFKQNMDFVVLGTLLALPAIVLAPLVVMYFLVIAPPSSDESDEEEAVESVTTIEVSDYAAAIATINAAPIRTAAPPNTTGDEAIAVAEAAGYTQEIIDRGEQNYLAVCTACHGVDAKGIAGLGKDLINGEFVHSQTDDELVAFIIKGREIWDDANTTGVAMPARGGNPGLTDADIQTIVAYLRVISGNMGPGGTTVVADAGTTPPDESATPAPAIDPNAPTASDEWTPPDLTGISGPAEGGSEPTASNADATAIYDTYCGDPLNQAACDYLVGELAAGNLDVAQVIDLLTLGTPAFDNPHPVTISQRGGMLMMSDADIALLGTALQEKAGVATPAPSSESNPVSSTRDGVAVYAAYCEGAGQEICDYLQGQLAGGSLTDEQVVDLLTLGTPYFDNPHPVTINQRGGGLLLSDAEIWALLGELKREAGMEVGAAIEPPPFYNSAETPTLLVNGQPNNYQPGFSYLNELKGPVVTPPREVQDFTLASTTGEDFTFSEQGGRVLLLYFGYLTCPDVCPATLADLRRVYLALDEPASRVTIAFITVDPERDTMDRIQRYVGAFNADFIGLRPTPEQLPALLENFNVTVEKREVESAAGYLIDHTAATYMVGPDGRILVEYPFGVPYEEITTDLDVMLDYTFAPINFAPRDVTSSDPAREYRIVIPEGTAFLMAQGTDPGVIPLKIELTLGERDILVLENHDDVDYLVGGIWVAPHETVMKQFFEPQTFVGLCTVTVGRDLVEIVVSAGE